MNFFSYLTMELKKLKHSKILLLLCIPVLMMWLPSIINSEKSLIPSRFLLHRSITFLFRALWAWPGL